jgi:hypothetical protein
MATPWLNVADDDLTQTHKAPRLAVQKNIPFSETKFQNPCTSEPRDWIVIDFVSCSGAAV